MVFIFLFFFEISKSRWGFAAFFNDRLQCASWSLKILCCPSCNLLLDQSGYAKNNTGGLSPAIVALPDEKKKKNNKSLFLVFLMLLESSKRGYEMAPAWAMSIPKGILLPLYCFFKVSYAFFGDSNCLYHVNTSFLV